MRRGVAGGVSGLQRGLQLAGCSRGARVGAGVEREGLDGVRERERFRGHTCGRRAPGTVQAAPGRRPCERRSARGGTWRVCAGHTGRAVRVCACARRACPAVLKDTSGRRRRSRCPGDVTARPSDNRPVPEPSADTRGGSGGGGGGGRGDSRARPGREEQELGARRTVSAAPRDLCGSFRGVSAASSARAAACGPTRTDEAAGTVGAVSGGGDRGAAGGGDSSRPGRVTALGAGPGRAGERFPRVSPSFPRAFSPGPGAQGRRAPWVVKRD